MDTSKTYIKMCDCPEIQVNARKETLFVGTLTSSDRITRVIFADNGDIKAFTEDGIYLPRQDQLQEMLIEYDWGVNFVRFKLFAEAFDHQETTPTSRRLESNLAHFTSMEQLWLAFVMKEKFGKTWDGEKWVTEK